MKQFAMWALGLVMCASCAQAPDQAPTAIATFQATLVAQTPRVFASSTPIPTPAPTAISTPSITPIPTDPLSGDVYPTPALDGLVRERRELRFESGGVTLAGELSLPLADNPPLVFLVHHAGPVPRDAYGYLAEILTRAGYAVLRFDKRGTGGSEGAYGCCEADDALAAYGAVMKEEGFDRCHVFVVAQSIGTQHVAERFAEFARVQQPRGVALLSNLLGPDQIEAIAAPIHIVVSDGEPNMDVVSRDAAQAHRAAFSLGATYYVAAGSEHTLFDVSSGPMDWRDPAWVTRYHRGAMDSLVDWLNEQRTSEVACPSRRAG